ncbi:MAG TPA: ABC transporter permease [Acidimicrobiales bacterium]|nr:ABC transporter permease [Acidimicrobiales bacterium]
MPGQVLSPVRPPAPALATRQRRERARLVVLYLLTVWVLVTLIFALPRTLPGDPLRAYVDEYTLLGPEQREELERAHGLDGSLLDQYGRYLSGLARGDLGQSIALSQPVSRLLRYYLPWTLLLTGSALLVSSIAGYRLGVTAAWRRNSGTDRALQVTTTGLRAVPEYAAGTLLLIVFGVVLRLFPISEGITPFTASEPLLERVVDVIWHLVLPLATLSLGLLGTKVLMVRNITVGVLGQDYMLLARAKGLPEAVQRRHHAGRNAMLPYLNLVGAQAGVAVGGGVFVQEVFGYPGVGRLMSSSVTAQDFPVIEGCFLTLSLLVLTVNLLVDLATTVVDPRTRAR